MSGNIPKLRVRVLSLKKNGLLVGSQFDFFGEVFYVVLIGKNIYHFKKDEIKIINSKIIY